MIPDGVMIQIREYLQRHNRHYLLACYLTHYMCIRPKELSRMRVGDINIGACTITLMGDQTKNHDSVTITMPQKVARLMIDLDIFSAHGGDYLFSDGFKPGTNQHSEKHFRDYWMKHLRKDLRFPAQYKYYYSSCLNGNFERACDFAANLCALSLYSNTDFCEIIDSLDRNLRANGIL